MLETLNKLLNYVVFEGITVYDIALVVLVITTVLFVLLFAIKSKQYAKANNACKIANENYKQLVVDNEVEINNLKAEQKCGIDNVTAEYDKKMKELEELCDAKLSAAEVRYNTEKVSFAEENSKLQASLDASMTEIDGLTADNAKLVKLTDSLKQKIEAAKKVSATNAVKAAQAIEQLDYEKKEFEKQLKAEKANSKKLQKTVKELTKDLPVDEIVVVEPKKGKKAKKASKTDETPVEVKLATETPIEVPAPVVEPVTPIVVKAPTKRRGRPKKTNVIAE